MKPFSCLAPSNLLLQKKKGEKGYAEHSIIDDIARAYTGLNSRLQLFWSQAFFDVLPRA
jgi:hypothetical protein